LKRSVTEILRRGFESMLGNWQLMVIRVGESVLVVVLCFAAVIATIGPLLVSFGLRGMAASR
jgi:hypothetical protein